jgi:hypothetical protein
VVLGKDRCTQHRRWPRRHVWVLLAFCGVATIATSPEHTSPYLMGWSSDFGSQVKVKVNISQQMLDYLHDQVPNQAWYIDVYLNDVDQAQAGTTRWWLLDGETDLAASSPQEFAVEIGGAPPLHFANHLSGFLPGDVIETSEGIDAKHHAVVRLGRLCYRESAAADCLPCSLKEGCSFSMVLDACGAQHIDEAIFVVKHGDDEFITCENTPTVGLSCEENDERPCQRMAGLGETIVTPFEPSADTPLCREVVPAVDAGVPDSAVVDVIDAAVMEGDAAFGRDAETTP